MHCRSCRTILEIPGLPPVHADEEPESEPEPEPVEPPDDAEDEEFEEARKPSRADTVSEPEPEQAPVADPSRGIASLYLAAMSFLLFFTPAVLASMLSMIGASIAFFAGAFTTGGCFLFCWHGLRLVDNVDPEASGQGYVIAAKLVNKFFLKFYALAFLFFLGVGIYVVVRLKNATGGGGGGVGDTFKMLQDLQKSLGQ
jgi:hypothetical protein